MVNKCVDLDCPNPILEVVKHQLIAVLTSATSFKAFAKSHNLPEPADGVQAVILSLFVQPGSAVFRFDEKHEANFSRLVDCFGVRVKNIRDELRDARNFT
ncbi:hypothetical protein PG989_004372 [Apiospora arundinis]